MDRYYLFVPESNHNPAIVFVKTCTAANKETAVVHFQKIMDDLSGENTFLRDELLQWIKEEGELTEQDSECIKRIGILPDIPV